MDTIRGQEEIGGGDAHDSGAIEAPPAISADERRMHVRAYNYWASLLGNSSLPSIEDLNPSDMEDFAPNSVLLDFSLGLENPGIIYLGSALREECGITGTIERADQVPPRSLLSRLTDHYLQIIANAAPVGFEAEFVNQRGAEIMYRGILMPFSSNDETIDFIYGVISWKEVATKSLSDSIDEEMRAAMSAAPARQDTAPIWADGPSATADYEDDGEDEEEAASASGGRIDAGDFGFDDVAPEHMTPANDASEEVELDLSAFLDSVDMDAPLELDSVAPEEEGVAAVPALDDDAAEIGLPPEAAMPGDDVLELGAEFNRFEPAPIIGATELTVEPAESGALPAMLDMARRSAFEARDCDARGRSALYRAIGDAYDFALAARDVPEDYAAMLEGAGITVQERSPMTAVIKLIFGVEHDKTRIAEYALALDYGFARALPRGGLTAELDAHEGGLKGLVRDMRAARKSGEAERPARQIERAVKKLGRAKAADPDALPFDEHGLAVVVARREEDGSVTLIAGVDLSDKSAQKVAIAASKLV